MYNTRNGAPGDNVYYTQIQGYHIISVPDYKPRLFYHAFNPAAYTMMRFIYVFFQGALEQKGVRQEEYNNIPAHAAYSPVRLMYG